MLIFILCSTLYNYFILRICHLTAINLISGAVYNHSVAIEPHMPSFPDVYLNELVSFSCTAAIFQRLGYLNLIFIDIQNNSYQAGCLKIIDGT